MKIFKLFKMSHKYLEVILKYNMAMNMSLSPKMYITNTGGNVKAPVSAAFDPNSPLAFFLMFFRNQEELNLYRYVGLTVVLIVFQFVVTSFVAPGRVRGKVFNK
jgi:hypothetical protein